jgi:predicted nucleic acid-binding Zn ribbon protein
MPFTNLNRKLARQDQFLKKNSGKKRNYKKMLIKIFVVLLILFVVIYLPVRGA